MVDVESILIECLHKLQISFKMLNGVYDCEKAIELVQASVLDPHNTENEINYYKILTHIFKNLIDEDECLIVFTQFSDNNGNGVVLVPVIYFEDNDGSTILCDALCDLCDVRNEWGTQNYKWVIEDPNAPICEAIRRELLGKVMIENLRCVSSLEMYEVRRQLSDFI